MDYLWKTLIHFIYNSFFCLNRLFSAEFPRIVLTHVLYCKSAVAHALQFPWSFGLNKSIFSKGKCKKKYSTSTVFFQHFYWNSVWMVSFSKIWGYCSELLIIHWAHQVVSINHQHCNSLNHKKSFFKIVTSVDWWFGSLSDNLWDILVWISE